MQREDQGGPYAEATQREIRAEDCEGLEVGGKQKTHVVEAERGSAEGGTAIRPFAGKGAQVGGMEITVTWVRADAPHQKGWKRHCRFPQKAVHIAELQCHRFYRNWSLFETSGLWVFIHLHFGHKEANFQGLGSAEYSGAPSEVRQAKTL